MGDRPVLAYPNPAADRVRFLVHLDEAADVVLDIYNANGERAAGIRRNLPAGAGQVLTWSCGDVGPGVYFVRVTINGEDRGKVKIAVVEP